MKAEPVLDFLTPESMGLDPVKFPAFREVQLEAIEKAAFSEKRFVGMCLPTGSGKELVAMGLSRFTGKRTMILTHTLGLMGQYIENHESFGLGKIMGRANYECPEYEDCQSGAEMGCGLCRKKACTYQEAKWFMESKQDVISNYAWWIHSNQFGDGKQDEEETDDALGIGSSPGRELLILDEAHYAHQVVSDFLGFRLTERDLQSYLDPKAMSDYVQGWKDAAMVILVKMREDLRDIRMEAIFLRQHKQKYRKLMELLQRTRSLYQKIYRLATTNPEDWICELEEGTDWGRRWSFDVIWPGAYTERYLFCGVPKVMLMSATLTRKSMSLLGLAKDDYEFFEWGRQFPTNRNPMYYFPLIKKDKPLRITRGASDEDIHDWIAHIDSIIEPNLDRRIIVLTTSYKYQERIKQESKYGRFMMGNTRDPESGTAMDEFNKFIKTPPPVILCSPSFGVGWDFKGVRGEVLIISKLPLRPPPETSKLMQARVERDKDYYNNEVVQDLEQAGGRLMRSMEDRGVIYLTDGNWEWFRHTAKRLGTRGLESRWRRINKFPGKAPKL